MLNLIHRHPKIRTSTTYKYHEAFDPQIKADIIILGDSRSQAGVNPWFFNIYSERVYNFSITGARFSFVKEFYQKLLKRFYPKPKIILYFLNSEDLLSDGRNLDQDGRFFPWKYWLEKFLQRKGKRKMMIMSSIELFENRPDLLVDLLGSQVRIDDVTRYYNGYNPYSHTSMRLKDMLDKISELELPKMNGNGHKEFEKLIQEWTSAGIHVVLIQTPVFRLQNMRSKNNKELVQREMIVDHIALKTNTPYLKYNTEDSKLMRDWKLFRDPDHLNERGSAQYSITVAKDLSKILLSIYQKIPLGSLSYEDECFLGKLYVINHKYEKAKKHYNSAIDKNSNLAKAYVGLGVIENLEGRPKKSIKFYEKALHVEPHDIYALIYSGNEYLKLKNYMKAEFFYLKALEFEVQSELALTNLGILMSHVNKLKKANEYFKTVLKINPYNYSVKQYLEMIKNKN